MSMMMFAQAASSCSASAGLCPVSLGIAAVVGAAVGFVAGRLSKCAGNKNTKKAVSPSQKKGSSQPPPRRDLRITETRVPIPAGYVEIYVGNLSYDMDEPALRKTFEAFGTVHTARVVLNRYNNKSKGFGFVVMPNRPEAEKAIAALDEKDVMGRKMKVNEAKNTVKQEA